MRYFQAKMQALLFIPLFSIISYGAFAVNEKPQYVYKILTNDQWSHIQKTAFTPENSSTLDQKDGYIHLSTNAQTKKTALKYFSNLEDGYLVQVGYAAIEAIVRWEPNSKGELFAHAYG